MISFDQIARFLRAIRLNNDQITDVTLLRFLKFSDFERRANSQP